MAGNEWLNGYLEAILDAGGTGKGLEGGGGGSGRGENEPPWAATSLVPHLQFSPTKYFVEEVVNSFDEADLYKTWVKVIAMRNTRERNNRLENMCWRIWHLARKKKKIEREDARRLSKRRLEREQGHRDAAEDLSELSEGEKEKENGGQAAGPPKEKMLRINSDLRLWSDVDETKRLYIVLISLHGLVRGENMELGRDSDTGGQVKYVVELARALAATNGVHRVDLLTRQISTPDVDWSYGEPVEMLSRPSDVESNGDGCGAYIIRLPCGPRDRYLAKESLWAHIPEFVDRALAHITNVARSLGDQTEDGKPTWPYVIHGHYADAGEVAARLSGSLNVPMVMTGHSLGRNKFEQLLKQGRLSREDINSTYHIMRRIEAEELGLDAAEMVVTSTRQEIEEQWGLYDGFDVKIERKLRVRRRRGVSCLGRHMPRMVVIPPGMDFSYVTMDSPDGEGDLQSLIGPDRAQTRRNLPPIWSEVMRFFTNPHKPMILALSRPDPKKNVTTLLKAFGESRSLRELANLTLILGNRDDVEEGRIAVGVLKGIVEKVAAAAGPDGRTGLVISTGSTVAETIEALNLCRIAPSDFDALICSSGSEVCYPWKDLAPDPDYSAYVDYRWPGEHIRSAVPRLAKLGGTGKEDAEAEVDAMELDEKACGSHCYAYSLKVGAKARKTDELRQRLRMRGFRCNQVYTRACTRLNVVPLFASRAQALRYLWIRWGVELSEMVTFVGEKGDTDAEELHLGLHSAVVLGGCVQHGSERLLRSEESYKRRNVYNKTILIFQLIIK